MGAEQSRQITSLALSEKLFDLWVSEESLCPEKRSGDGWGRWKQKEERGPGSWPILRLPRSSLFLQKITISKGQQALLLSWLKALVLCRASPWSCCSCLRFSLRREDSLCAGTGSRLPAVSPAGKWALPSLPSSADAPGGDYRLLTSLLASSRCNTPFP